MASACGSSCGLRPASKCKCKCKLEVVRSWQVRLAEESTRGCPQNTKLETYDDVDGYLMQGGQGDQGGSRGLPPIALNP